MPKSLSIVFLLVIATAFNIYAQNKRGQWYCGYIVIEQNKRIGGYDTIYGDIKIAKNIGGYEIYKIKFCDDSNNVITYQASDIKSFKIDNHYYDSAVKWGLFSFAERIISGELNLYIHQSSAPGNTGYASKEKSIYLRKIDSNNLIYIPKTSSKFVKIITEFISDNEDLNKKVIDKELKYKDIKEIVTIYNDSSGIN